jgi:hypothetical protein
MILLLQFLKELVLAPLLSLLLILHLHTNVVDDASSLKVSSPILQEEFCKRKQKKAFPDIAAWNLKREQPKVALETFPLDKSPPE